MPETLVEQLDHIFKPKSVAVIGASNDYSKWGGRVLGNALRSEFRGRIYPVNPRGGEIQGVEAYKDVRDIPDHVEMAIFTLPAAHVPAAMKACVEKGVKGAYMISAGFAETGEEGRKLEQETVRIANEGGLRFAGPNGNGIWTSAVNLNILPFTGIKNGPLAFISQSGTFCGVAGRAAESRGYGMSKVVAIGNQANITAADYLEYLGQDEDTKVIGMYLEGLKEGRRFFQVAKKVSRTKPIIIFKGGSSDFGARATLSHTASIAGEEAVFQAMCKQAGIIQVPEIEHLFIMAEALWSQPIPPGNRVAVIGNGGQCVTIVDLLASMGVDVPELKKEDQIKLKETMPPHAPMPQNPIDYAAGNMSGMGEVNVVETLLSLDYIDGVITNVPNTRLDVYFPSLAEQRKASIDIIAKFSELPEKYNKPIITQAWFKDEQTIDFLKKAKIPIYDTPAEVSRAMAALMNYSKIKKRPE
ncbi:MAG: hypothetical protein FP816_00595 [Desulfobacteraceae bacterium]|nr:hypothetical protein [Desulfobacteraceae bacterium]